MSKFIPLFFIPLLIIASQIGQTVFADNQSDEETAEPVILISEIQVGTEESARDEFVEIYNTTDENVDISDWELQYQSSDGETWTNKISSTQQNDTIYEIEPGEFYVLGTSIFNENTPNATTNLKLNSGLAQDGGHLRLARPTDKEDESWEAADLVGWGDAKNVYEYGKPAPAPTNKESITRCFEDEELVNTYNNLDDFLVNKKPSPGEGDDCPESDPDDEIGDDNDENPDENEENNRGNDENSNGSDSGDGPDENNSSGGDENDDQSDVISAGCDGIVISEVLPNPEGPRSENPREDNAFVELYNSHSTDYIRLDECGLQSQYESTGNMSEVYKFQDVELAPGERRAFYERETGVNLPVSPSGTVYLLSSAGEELESITYPQDMPEGASWAWFGEDEWAKTFEPSPAEDNIEQSTRPCPDGQERSRETKRCRNITDNNESDLVPCKPHQERNPETNRCRNIDQGNDFVPCEPHQERNPETNRCRNIESASSDLVPCESHQERNPETNRCRNIDNGRDLVPCESHQERNPETNRCRNKESAASDLVPCEPHQERNPETNRCRNKVVDNEDAIAGVQDVKTVATGTPTNWYFAGSLLLLALAYAGYEWRYDIRNFITRKKKLKPPTRHQV